MKKKTVCQRLFGAAVALSAMAFGLLPGIGGGGGLTAHAASGEPVLSHEVDYGDKIGKYTDKGAARVRFEGDGAQDGWVYQVQRQDDGKWSYLDGLTGYFTAGSQEVRFRSVDPDYLDEILAAEKASGISAQSDDDDSDGAGGSGDDVDYTDSGAGSGDDTDDGDDTGSDDGSAGEDGDEDVDLSEHMTDWKDYSFIVKNSSPVAPTLSISVDYTDYQNGFTQQAKVKANISAEGTDPDDMDSVKLEWEDIDSSGYFALGNYTVRVRSVDEFGACSAWTEKTFSVATSKSNMTFTSTTLGNATSVSGSSASVSMTVNVTCSLPVKVQVADMYGNGAILHSADMEKSGATTFSATYAGGRHMLVARGVGLFGDTGYTSKMFVVGSSTNTGGGKMESTGCTLTDPGMYQNGKPIAYINAFTVNNPLVPGHGSNRDTFTILGLVYNGGWETIVTGSCASHGGWGGSSVSGKITAGSGNKVTSFTYQQNRYVQLKFIYYSDHPTCMKNAGTSMSYSVEYAYMQDSLNDSMWDSIVTTKRYNVVTSVSGPGYIDPSVYNAPEGGSVDIEYSPYVGGYLKELVVDGKSYTGKALAALGDTYHFTDLSANHTVNAVFALVPKLTVTDSVDTGSLVSAKGGAYGMFKVSGVNYKGDAVEYFMGGVYDANGRLSLSRYVDAGTYTVSCLSREWLSGSSDVPVDLSSAAEGSAGFGSKMSSYAKYTDCGFKENIVKEGVSYDEAG